MTRDQIIAKVKALNLPRDSYVVYGSGPMAAAGLREANDIDLLVSEEVYAELKKAGWQELRKSEKDIPVVHDVFEAHPNWNFSSYSPTLNDLLASVTMIENVPFASLEEVRKWKVASARPEDLADVKIIDKYMESKNDF